MKDDICFTPQVTALLLCLALYLVIKEPVDLIKNSPVSFESIRANPIITYRPTDDNNSSAHTHK